MAEMERAVPGLAHRPADAARAMILLGWPTRTLWPAAVHRRWLERGWAIAQDAAIPDDDRLLLAVNRATALLTLGDEAGWAASGRASRGRVRSPAGAAGSPQPGEHRLCGAALGPLRRRPTAGVCRAGGG